MLQFPNLCFKVFVFCYMMLPIQIDIKIDLSACMWLAVCCMHVSLLMFLFLCTPMHYQLAKYVAIKSLVNMLIYCIPIINQRPQNFLFKHWLLIAFRPNCLLSVLCTEINANSGLCIIYTSGVKLLKNVLVATLLASKFVDVMIISTVNH